MKDLLPKIVNTAVAPLNIANSLLGTINKIIEYKALTKAIDLQMLKIEKEAALMHHRINVEHDLAVKSLMNDRLRIMQQFARFADEQSSRRATKEVLSQSILEATRSITDPNVPVEVKLILPTVLDVLRQSLADESRSGTILFLGLAKGVGAQNLLEQLEDL